MGKSPDFILDVNLVYGNIVYGWRRGDDYLYVGRAKQLGRLSTGHHIIGKREPVLSNDKFDIWTCSSISDALDLELELIRKYEPPYNRETVALIKRAIRNQKRMRVVG